MDAVSAILMDAGFAMSQPASVEYQVKAAFLFNFAKFVAWPREAFPRSDSPFTICLAGDPFDGAVDRIVQGEVLDGRPLTVRRVNTGEAIRSCQIIYVAPSEARRSEEIINAVMNAPVLTVGEDDNFINEGGIIHFVKTGGRIRFQINPEAAEHASLKVSSRLLRLAEIARPRQRAGVTR